VTPQSGRRPAGAESAQAGDESGGTGPAASSATVPGLLRWQCRARPETVFIVFEDPGGSRHEVTYAGAWQRAQATAAVLRDQGVGTGDRVLVALPNCLEFFDLWFACGILGATLVPVSPLSTPDELAWVLTDAACRACVGDSVTAGSLRQAQALSSATDIPLLTAADGPELTGRHLTRLARLPEPAEILAHPASEEDIAAVLYTSGTTSRPKGVLITHANYLCVGEAVAGHLRIRPADRWLVVLPLFHANAQYYCVMSALMSGASLAVAARFSASGWSRQAWQLGATLASLFAAPVRMILASPGQPHDRRNQLRAALFAQNLTTAQAQDFGRRFGTPLLQLYGMTETVAPPTCNPLYGEQRADSIGRPLAGARLRIVDEHDRDVPVGASGELLVAGQPGRTLMAGYLNRPDATEEALRDGWLHTGDLVRVGADGYLYFVDWAKDMIKRAGENVAASEVERAINEHPGVFDSAAVGVPDTIRDEAIVVHVVLRPAASVTEEELITWCRERLAPFKVPTAIRFTGELPRTSVGKIRKDVLRRQEPGDDAAGGDP
jgi:carnitine-CoA ligase